MPVYNTELGTLNYLFSNGSLQDTYISLAGKVALGFSSRPRPATATRIGSTALTGRGRAGDTHEYRDYRAGCVQAHSMAFHGRKKMELPLATLHSLHDLRQTISKSRSTNTVFLFFFFPFFGLSKAR
uniref:Uncharacterized protein n=1 Tax=Rhizophora mucronata TaxID=61149 RepID=A0A2P2MVA7_RHIMU